MTTPRPRDVSDLSQLTIIDAKRHALAADVRRLTDQEASGPAKAATGTWINTATEIELDIWLTLSDQAFIDAVNSKARPRGRRHKNGRANVGNINLAREDQGRGRDSWGSYFFYRRSLLPKTEHITMDKDYNEKCKGYEERCMIYARLRSCCREIFEDLQAVRDCDSKHRNYIAELLNQRNLEHEPSDNDMKCGRDSTDTELNELKIQSKQENERLSRENESLKTKLDTNRRVTEESRFKLHEAELRLRDKETEQATSRRIIQRLEDDIRQCSNERNQLRAQIELLSGLLRNHEESEKAAQFQTASKESSEAALVARTKQLELEARITAIQQKEERLHSAFLQLAESHREKMVKIFIQVHLTIGEEVRSNQLLEMASKLKGKEDALTELEERLAQSERELSVERKKREMEVDSLNRRLCRAEEERNQQEEASLSLRNSLNEQRKRAEDHERALRVQENENLIVQGELKLYREDLREFTHRIHQRDQAPPDPSILPSSNGGTLGLILEAENSKLRGQMKRTMGSHTEIEEKGENKREESGESKKRGKREKRKEGGRERVDERTDIEEKIAVLERGIERNDRKLNERCYVCDGPASEGRKLKCRECGTFCHVICTSPGSAEREGGYVCGRCEGRRQPQKKRKLFTPQQDFI
ncbi:hypothetical protein PROFUN_06732 [Planoprotostelium fungivorum]|uniref:Uncharacterized protein n=1 Tax=Planoprotostelium fungivorum TaxID=1890364 RepID=A0A2P6NG83_9EUKA|nr:hypothetical protein PROFUN_06732 [Planoprotostelium fungivorum]